MAPNASGVKALDQERIFVSVNVAMLIYCEIEPWRMHLDLRRNLPGSKTV